MLDEIIEKYNNGMSILKLSKEYPYSYDVISRHLKENGIKIRGNSFYQSKYYFDESFFDTIDNQYKAYWLGFIFADGFISKSTHGRECIGIAISKIDENHLHKFKEHIKSTYPINTYKVIQGFKIGAEYVRILMRSDKAIRKLKEYGIDYKKSFNCKFPSEDIVPKYLMNHFIRGYYDGNGSLKLHGSKNSTKDYTIAFCGTKDMMENIQKYIPINRVYKLR